MSIPDVLTHYYEAARGPFRSLTALEPGEADRIQAHIRASGQGFADRGLRLRRLGLVAAELDRGFAGAPDVHILSLTPRESTAQVEFEVKPQRKPVTRYQIYANDVPLFGLAGRALPGQGGRFRGRHLFFSIDRRQSGE